MLPLVPTQPFALVSGLVFGPAKGALVTLVGTATAASIAFSVAKGPAGKTMSSLAARLEGNGSEASGALERVLGDGVADMDWRKQILSVVVLRISPVVPFSISNYLLGLTGLKFGPFLVGTLLGMAPWSILYGSIGASCKTLLASSDPNLANLLGVLKEDLGPYSTQLELLGVGTAFMFGVLVFDARRRSDAATEEK